MGHLLTNEGIKIDPDKVTARPKYAQAYRYRRRTTTEWLCELRCQIPATTSRSHGAHLKAHTQRHEVEMD